MGIKCHALDNWKACRSALATAIQSYLAACTDLRITCSQIQHPYKTRREAELVPVTIDAELASLASEEEELGKSRVSLSVLRNRSSTLAPVHSLPPEVLARIFLMAQCCSDGQVSNHAFARVSTYWRTTAISLPTLWTYIDVRPAQTNYEYATLSLSRSNNLPVRLNVSSEGLAGRWNGYSSIPAWEGFLASVSQQIQTLDVLDSFLTPETLLDGTMRLLLRCSSLGVLKALCIKRPYTDGYVNLEDFSGDEFDQFDSILRSITVLHLSDVRLPWTSGAYHNLTDLRLQFTGGDDPVISSLGLARILAASPGLTTLKLEYILITRSGGWNAENAVRLARLEVLCLFYLSRSSLAALASVLSISDCLGPLEVGLQPFKWEGVLEISPVIRDLLHGVRVKTLAISLLGDDDPQWAPSLLAAVPSLECLILSDYDLLKLHGDKTIGDEPKINVDTPSRLPHLFLASSGLDLENLKLIVSVSGAEILHLDRVQSQHMLDRGAPRDELRAALLDAFPRLTCVITDEDTTLKWPCRTVLDW